MGVKCLAQEHNTVPQPGLEPGPFDPESSGLTIRPPRLPYMHMLNGICLHILLLYSKLLPLPSVSEFS